MGHSGRGCSSFPLTALFIEPGRFLKKNLARRADARPRFGGTAEIRCVCDIMLGI